MDRKLLLSTSGQLRLPQMAPRLQQARPVFDSRRAQLAESRKTGKRPLLPISCNEKTQLTVHGPNGVKVLHWRDSGQVLLAGDLPAGTKIVIEGETGACWLP